MRPLVCAALGLGIGVVAPSTLAQSPPQERIRIDRAADLPRHTYNIATSLGDLVRDTAQFNELARQLEADLRSDLARYVIEDRATLKFYYGILSDLAVERGEYDMAVDWQNRIRAIEDKPAERLMTGIVERSLAQAGRSARDRFADSFREAFRREVSALPYADVRGALATLRQGTQYASQPNALDAGLRMMEQQRRGGPLSLPEAHALVRLRTSVNGRTPPTAPLIAAVISEVMTANEMVAKRDIWADREVSLDGRAGLTPILVAIWDSGVDVTLFPDRLFVNTGEVAGNGRDDDRNGYVDDVHGIAYDVKHARTTGVLGPITRSSQDQADYVKHMKGRSDLANGVASPEAKAFTEKLFSLGPANIRDWNTGMTEYEEYIHGTHVAGIAMRGNPAARLLVGRNEEDYWKPAPERVTLETERARARESRETVDYFKRCGVRVVNMSWAYSPRWYEGILAKNEPGGNVDERKRLAREMFEVIASALRAAVESAPEILFVTGAGNANDDIRFMERVPSAFQLPNLITTGAVDYAGDEAPFTSYGNVHVHANGSSVSSVVPGGTLAPASGTSMAAPQVANLAAKLLALKPGLTVGELRRAIIEAADEKRIAEGKTIRVLNPRASVDRVMGPK